MCSRNKSMKHNLILLPWWLPERCEYQTDLPCNEEFVELVIYQILVRDRGIDIQSLNIFLQLGNVSKYLGGGAFQGAPVACSISKTTYQVGCCNVSRNFSRSTLRLCNFSDWQAVISIARTGMMALISRMEGKESLSSIFLFFRGYNYKSWSLIPNIQIIDLSSWWRQKYKFNSNLKYTISSGSVSKCSIQMSN